MEEGALHDDHEERLCEEGKGVLRAGIVGDLKQRRD